MCILWKLVCLCLFIINVDYIVINDYYQGALLLVWITSHMPCKMWDEITYPFLNFNTVEVWEWISNFFSHFVIDLITYPCWTLNNLMRDISPASWLIFTTHLTLIFELLWLSPKFSMDALSLIGCRRKASRQDCDCFTKNHMFIFINNWKV